MIERAAVVAEARRWLGTRYRHQGRVRGVGVDCLGLLICVARELGVVAADFDINGYSRQPDGDTFQRGCEHYMQAITRAEALPGDVVSIAFGGHPMHAAILGDYAHGGLSLIHALANARKCVEHRFDDVWQSRVAGWYRMNGVV